MYESDILTCGSLVDGLNILIIIVEYLLQVGVRFVHYSLLLLLLLYLVIYLFIFLFT